ncbi:histidine kinase : Putative sensor histidine kinase OS=Variovorax paradoxus B4 GN=VAPA_1c17480 PE=4 SV=1: HisKA: HATPase_c: Response_reg [Gemmata massiliana]|uniref:histidine kinase n=1 Tax=Gemmata massiliana TaxID=1210884 RepID=A0A6P2D6S3_9BACT|nr:ATP-binding protein [Gemmata massiliana]VTR95120.1 histidine kinase : Putative sensor histidine kinase OS=Variovorax paradoxus B4 GN=VAPA_1c17480 PE=4 SV=1: HisKA: HATPase_c: Response_reg [Gemmata massiliana]
MPDTDERVLFLSPTKKDATAGLALMAGAGLTCHACASLAELCREIPVGVGTVIVPEEAAIGDGAGALKAAIRDQPPWSNLPILVLTAAGPTATARVKALIELGDITLLKRPLEAAEFLNAVRAALRDRRRQYQVRGYIAEQTRQAEELRDADRRKDEFLAMLAHELRNPLAPIRNGLAILGLRDGDREVVHRTHGMMSRQVDHLSRLVDDLLDVSRITRGKVELRVETVDLNAVLARAAEAARPLIDARRHRLIVTQPGRPVLVSADPTRLAQVVGNLLTNAAKYSDEGGRIELILEEDGVAIVRVRDTGLGIPADMLPRVFDLFTQVGRTLDRADGGLGIGLTLVKSLVELHGGTVSVASDGPGKGSEFTVRLPKRARGKEKGEPGSVTVPLAARRVLIVDDNPDAGDSLAELLRLSGHAVEVARSGMLGLEAARKLRPDTALLDIGLPGMSGYELAGRLRAEPFGAGVLLVALTGYGQEDDRKRSAEAGFDHHLTKPADLSALMKLLSADRNR